MSDPTVQRNELAALIPEGPYKVRFVQHETLKMFGSPKLRMEFKIIDYGNYFETRLNRYYTLHRLIGNPCVGGRFKPTGQTSVLLVHYYACHPTAQRIKRLDRISMTPWRDGEYIAEVVTVRRNHSQRQLPVQLQYSVIDDLRRAV
jgi:hypothetical protein